MIIKEIMITNGEILEIREHLERAQNPLFFFDNDADGLCSFLILQRSIGRGKGVAIKSYPDLSKQYLRKVEELNPDAIFILDKAEVSQDFVSGITIKNLPIIWIDHHKSLTDEEVKGKTFYYNSYPESEPTTYIAQKIFNRQEDLWIAMVGCISDVYMPDFAHQFEKRYPELFNSKLNAFDALHATEIGKFCLMFNFGLMNSVTNVIKLIKYLIKINSPHDLLEENFYTKDFHRRYNELKSELEKLVLKASLTKVFDNNILFFNYAGATSMSAILSSRILFENPKRLVVVGYSRSDKVNLSIRGKGSLELTKYILEKIEGSTGGGHKEATGAMIPSCEQKKLKSVLKDYKSPDV